MIIGPGRWAVRGAVLGSRPTLKLGPAASAPEHLPARTGHHAHPRMITSPGPTTALDTPPPPTNDHEPNTQRWAVALTLIGAKIGPVASITLGF